MTEKIRCALYSIMYSIMGIALGIVLLLPASSGCASFEIYFGFYVLRFHNTQNILTWYVLYDTR